MDPLKVLIVDDEPDVSKLMKIRLSMEAPHLALSTVESAEECLEYLKENSVDCILSDFQMPGTNGMDLLKTLRRLGDDTPLIFITGQGNEEIAREAFKSGANDYFTKDVGFAHFARIVNSIEQAVRQRTAREAKENELAFRRAIEDSVLSGIVGVDLSGRLNYANPAFCRMVGWSEEELIGTEPPFVFWPPEDRESTGEVFSLILQGKMQSRSVEVRFMRKNGERFYVLKLVSALKDSHGKVQGWLNAVYDITGRKRTEEALRAKEESYRLLFEYNPQPMFVFDPKSLKILAVNHATVEYYGYTEEEFLDMSILDIRPEEDRQALVEYLAKAPQHLRRCGVWRHMKKDGTVFDVEVYASPVVFEGRQAVFTMAYNLTNWLDQDKAA